MSGIIGIVSAERDQTEANKMLEKIAHRGNANRGIIETPCATLGAVWTGYESNVLQTNGGGWRLRDGSSPGHYAMAEVIGEKVTLLRDPIGVSPLYYGTTGDGGLCFASEVKALLELTTDVRELPPGHRYSADGLKANNELEKQSTLDLPPEEISRELRHRLDKAIQKGIDGDEAGSWLSGGLDSSTIAALARQHVSTVRTFAAGLPGAPDLVYAREVAEHLQTVHQEVIVSLEMMLQVLPQVIYHLESFDALLVRSSVMNYLVAQRASEFVPAVFSGEGGDELFAGYEYLKAVPTEQLEAELLDIIGRLHNTALQRVDRSASAHGLVPHVSFLDPDVVDYALRIPPEYKLRDGEEKWILRRAVEDLLPESVVNRTKAKFWEGAGVEELLAQYAEEQISGSEFARERTLPNGWTLNSKEELMYWRIFREQFGELLDLGWMGRTKGAPVV